MGAVIVSAAMSVDGDTGGAGGDITTLPLDAAFNPHNAALIARAGSLLFGARTYREMVGYWPGQLDSPDPSERAIAQRLSDGLPVTAVSDTLTADDTGPWRAQTTIVPRADAHARVAELRRGEGDAVVFGSQTVWVDLLSHGLVDELQLLVGPRITGRGVPALAGVPTVELRLLDARRVEGTESVLLRYATGP